MWCVVHAGVKVCCVDIHWECCVLIVSLVGVCLHVSGIYGAEWVLMGVVLLWRFGLAVGWLCLCTRMYMRGVLLCIKKCCDV